MAQSFRFLFVFLISTSAFSQKQMREIIRHGHDFAKKKCEKKGREIQKDSFEGIDYKITGRSRYVSRYHKNCEEALCKVFFSEESWQYQKGFFVCSLPKEKIKQDDINNQFVKSRAIKEKKIRVVAVRKKIKKEVLRAPASVKKIKHEIPKAKIKENLQVSCQEFVTDINTWLVKLGPKDGIPQNKDSNGLFTPLTTSYGTQKIAKIHFERTQDDTHKVLETKLEMIKIKVGSLINGDNSPNKYLANQVGQYNEHITAQFKHYMGLAKTYCFDSFVNNHKNVVGKLDSYEQDEGRTPASEESKSPSIWGNPPDGLILEED